MHGPVEPRSTHRVLTGPDRPTAVFTAQNLVTIDVLRTLHRLGLQDQVAHVGFDDIVLAGSIEPALTVVAQDALGLGRAAAELLFRGSTATTGRPGRWCCPLG